MQLHDYQRLAVSFLQKQPRAGLFLDMGLGKTAVVLNSLTPDHLPALVVAPKLVTETVWPEERDLWRPDLTYALAIGSPSSRKEALSSDADMIFISRDNMKDIPPYRHKWNTLVLDESSSFKNYRSTRFKMANGVALRTEHTWILSGTPTPNGYLDFWSQIFLLDQGARLGENITAYRNRWFYPVKTNANHVVTEWDTQEGAEDEIKKLVEDICLYMDSDSRITLPTLSMPDHHITLPKPIMEFYRKLKKDMVASMKEFGLTVSADNAGILSNRLSQVAAGFVYETDPETSVRSTHQIHEVRTGLIEELIEAAGSPVIIAYRYAEEERRFLQLPGARSIREKGIIPEWNNGNVPILVAHPASAGHGLNLARGGHHLIWASPDWPLELYQQMNKRLYRQGQQHPVVIHHIVAKGTTDPIIYARLTDKGETQQDLLNHLLSPV